MKSTLLSAVSSILLLAHSVSAQTSTTPDLKPIQTLSCYKSVDTLTEVGSYTYATDGWCQGQCGGLNKAVMAITAGSTCYCGDTIPALDQVASNSSCNTPCNGFDQKNCGGNMFWQVYLTGLTYGVPTAPNSTVSSSSSSSSSAGTATTAPAVITKAAATVVVTASSSSSAAPSSGSNKVGIAVGIVVTGVVVSAIAGGFIFFLKQRKKRAIEEEHRRREAAAAVEKSEVSSTITDQRLDPSNIFSHRRESIGSIADEMDFSRRILQVRNPDRFSTNSGA